LLNHLTSPFWDCVFYSWRCKVSKNHKFTVLDPNLKLTDRQEFWTFLGPDANVAHHICCTAKESTWKSGSLEVWDFVRTGHSAILPTHPTMELAGNLESLVLWRSIKFCSVWFSRNWVRLDIQNFMEICKIQQPIPDFSRVASTNVRAS